MNRIRRYFTLLFLFLFPVIISTCGGDESGCGTPPSPDPSTPTLTATAISEGQIDLSWTPSTDRESDLAGYKIYRNSEYLTTVSLTYRHITTYSDTNVALNTNYCYTVAAYDKQGNESYQSNEVCVFTDLTPPSAPGSLQAAPVSAGSIGLSWSASTDNGTVAGYRVYRDGTYLRSVAGSPAYDSNLSPGIQYCYSLSAYDMAGNQSSITPQVCATTTNLAISTIDFAGDVGQYTSLALDADGNVHISYYDATNQDLKYVTNATGTWVATPVDNDVLNYNMYSQYTSLALDSAGFAHICYAYGDLKYATNVSGSWVVSLVDNTFDVEGWYCSLSVDSSDKIHISYHHNNNGALMYATNAGGSWATAIVDSDGYVGEYTSLALDAWDIVHISYHDNTNGHLKYATNATGTWVSSLIDNTGNTGRYSSVAVDSQGKVHVSYHKSTIGDTVLKYATNASGAWTATTVDNIGYTGLYTSLALDAADRPHISYYDNSYGDLKYATIVAGSWIPTVMDTSGNVGQYTSLAVQSDGKVHISYYDVTNGDLKYATTQ